MPFSKRFAFLVLAGVVPVSLAALTDMAIIAFTVYNTALLALLIYDYIITPGSKSFEAERLCEEKFSLGAENKVVLKVRNKSGRSVMAELKDEIPGYFELVDSQLKTLAIPHEDCFGSYVVRPEKRGEYVFGFIHIRYNGILGLCLKSGKYDVAQSYKVYPNIKDLRRFNLASIKKSQLFQGTRKAKAYGIGTEFESLREYSIGDDYRKINWLATARSQKLIVNSYEQEKNQQIFILLDSSRVMNSEINFIKKLDYAINSAFLLVDFAIKKGDNAGLLVYDDTVTRFIKPGKGLPQIRLIADNLYNVEEKFVSADIKNALTYLKQNHKRRSLLCIFTELFNAEEALQMAAALKTLARNHIPLVITINDTRMDDMIEKDIKEAEDVFLKAASIKVAQEREKARKVLSREGIACIDVPPDKLSIEVLNKYIDMKATLQI